MGAKRHLDFFSRNIIALAAKIFPCLIWVNLHKDVFPKTLNFILPTFNRYRHDILSHPTRIKDRHKTPLSRSLSFPLHASYVVAAAAMLSVIDSHTGSTLDGKNKAAQHSQCRALAHSSSISQCLSHPPVLPSPPPVINHVDFHPPAHSPTAPTEPRAATDRITGRQKREELGGREIVRGGRRKAL